MRDGSDSETSPAVACPECGTEVPPALMACPSCRRLMHGDRLRALAGDAERATHAGDTLEALTAWRSALELVPPDSRHFQTIQAKVTTLARQIDEGPARPAAGGGGGPGWARGAGATGLGALALAAWKFKFLVLLALTKGKFLLLGLTKASTFYSMLLSIGVYSTAWGWKFALGFVLSIYIHEMGHVAALVRYGVKASAPMFIPGVGALVRLQQHFDDPRQEARVALAGPLWGLGAALGAYAIFLATGFAYWAGLARVGAMVNLFNLIPVWQLDGGRAFHSLTRSQRWLAATAAAAMWAVTSDGFVFLLLLVIVAQAAIGKPARCPDRFAALTYAALVIVLAALTAIAVPGR